MRAEAGPVAVPDLPFSLCDFDGHSTRIRAVLFDILPTEAAGAEFHGHKNYLGLNRELWESQSDAKYRAAILQLNMPHPIGAAYPTEKSSSPVG